MLRSNDIKAFDMERIVLHAITSATLLIEVSYEEKSLDRGCGHVCVWNRHRSAGAESKPTHIPIPLVETLAESEQPSPCAFDVHRNHQENGRPVRLHRREQQVFLSAGRSAVRQ